MVYTGFSTHRIRSYLHRFVLWWANTTEIWNYEELIIWFCDACFDVAPAAYAAGLLQKRIKESHSRMTYDLESVGLAVAAAAA